MVDKNPPTKGVGYCLFLVYAVHSKMISKMTAKLSLRIHFARLFSSLKIYQNYVANEAKYIGLWHVNTPPGP